MSRLKKESYIEYLEEVVMSLLKERDSDDDLVSAEYTEHPAFKDCTFSIYNIKNQIKVQRETTPDIPDMDTVLSDITYLNIRYGVMWHADEEIKRREMEISEEVHKKLYEWYKINKDGFDEQNTKVRDTIKKIME